GASTFTGTSAGRVASGSKIAAPSEFSTELWFKTNTNSGGKLMGYGASTFTGTSAGRVASGSKIAAPSEFSTELWFKT
ncbi:hypothetical protein CTI14_69260, partial [Methylobacterium radiotolerans]